MTGRYRIGDHVPMAADPESLAEFIAEPSDETQRRMRERQEDREELERTHVPVVPALVKEESLPVNDFVRVVERRIASWYRDGATAHPRDVALEIREDVRRAGFRDPPKVESEWKQRKPLPPERVVANVERAREALKNANGRLRADGPLGLDGEHSSPYEDPKPVPVAEATDQ